MLDYHRNPAVQTGIWELCIETALQTLEAQKLCYRDRVIFPFAQLLQMEIAAVIFIGKPKVNGVDNSVLCLQSTDMSCTATSIIQFYIDRVDFPQRIGNHYAAFHIIHRIEDIPKEWKTTHS